MERNLEFMVSLDSSFHEGGDAGREEALSEYSVHGAMKGEVMPH